VFIWLEINKMKNNNNRNVNKNSLIGKHFHSFQGDGHLKWQGQVVGSITGEVYLVQLFEWVTGAESNLRLVKLEEMLSWDFYQTREDMKQTYEMKYADQSAD
jgi:hypothetical protein